MEIISGIATTEYDVIVVGSGAGALSAAATAARFGKRVMVLEKSDLLGGTSAVSGGMIWMANNHHAQKAGFRDTRQAAALYVEAVARGRGRNELLDAALDYGDEALTFLEGECGLSFLLLEDFPDYRQDLPGAAEGGRTLEPALFNGAESLGELWEYVRSDGRAPFTMQEYEIWGAFTRFPWDELDQRQQQGLAAKGRALVAMLLATCRRDGVAFAIRARGVKLLAVDGKVTGVELENGETVTAKDGVVLATGGFEWDAELADSLLASRIYAQCSPPSNTGDGLKMAQRIGSKTRGTREAWWAPMAVVGDLRDGEPIGTLLRFERQGPGSIMVNRGGARFANESQNYNDLARSLHSWDSSTNQTLNTPVYIIFDSAYLERYGIFAHRKGMPTPDYLVEAPTLAELAQEIGVVAEALVKTVDRFNEHAVQGADPDFHRGETSYDRYWGDRQNSWPNPALGPLQVGPFYACEVVNGVFGTNGGITTDGQSRVLDVDDQVISGLFAVGNVTESAYAAGYPGAGATLGPILTMGYLAGRGLSNEQSDSEIASAGVTSTGDIPGSPRS
jgi:succinate dehydrogenase/fumarate reductase flavoprotein subunit